MLIDDIDLKIIYEFIKLKDKSVDYGEMMKKIYPKWNHREYMRVKNKIKRMEGYGLFFVNGNSYTLIKDKVFIKKIRFENNEKNFIFFLADDKWCGFECK